MYKVTLHSDTGYADHNDRTRKPEHLRENGTFKVVSFTTREYDASEAHSLKKCEIEEYGALYKKWMDEKNARAIKARHQERIITAKELYEEKPPEELLVTVNDAEANKSLSANALLTLYANYLKDELKQYPFIRVLDIAIHDDENGAPHIHARYVYIASDGSPNKKKALKENGYDGKDTRFDNPTTRFTADRRALLISHARAHGLEIDDVPRRKDLSGLSLKQYKAIRDKNRILRAYLDDRGLTEDFNAYIKETRKKPRFQRQEQEKHLPAPIESADDMLARTPER